MASVAIPIALDCSSMTLKQVIQRREGLLNDIELEVKQLNEQFENNPLQLKTDQAQELFERLKEVNETLENKRAELETQRTQKKFCGIQGVKKMTWVTLGMEFFIAALIASVEITNLVITEGIDAQIGDVEKACGTSMSTDIDTIKGLGITRMIIVAISAGLLVPLISAIKGIDSDMDKALLLNRISEIKEQGKEFRDFLASFKQFKQDAHPDSPISQKKLQASLKQCAECLDQLPPGDLRNNLPHKDHWISLMLRLLPEDHPIKTQLKEMRDAAIERSHPRRTLELAAEVIHAAPHPINDSEDEDSDACFSASGEVKDLNEKFRGERMSAPLFESESQKKGKKVTQIVDTDLRKQLRTHWEELEHLLGTQINFLQLEGIALSKNAQIAPKISFFLK